MVTTVKSFWDKLTSLHIVSDPDVQRNHKWRHMLVVDYKPFLLVGYEFQLIQYNGKPHNPPRPGNSYYLGFQYNPMKWEIGQSHIWYDGPHCSYQFGPFIYQHCGGHDCKKCRDGA